MGVRYARILLRKYRERGATTVHPGNKAIIVSTQNGALQNCGGFRKRKARVCGPSSVAGAGFEPATSGL